MSKRNRTGSRREQMKHRVAWGLLAFMAIGLGAMAQDKPKLKSTTPVVQDARWAVKWWMPRHKQKLEQVEKANGKIDLVLIGDSITHGWENSGKAVFKKYYGNRNTLNLGFSGDRTEHVLWRLQNDAVKGIKPKLAIIMIGTNNAGHRKEKSEETAAGVKAILDDLKTRLPETKILLLAIFPRGEKPTDHLRMLNVGTNKIIETYADGKRVHWLNINDKFLTKDGILTKEIMRDRLHPGAKGYEIWAETVEPTVKKLMGEQAAKKAA
jgi:lysophospholipase L1-like esterase